MRFINISIIIIITQAELYQDRAVPGQSCSRAELYQDRAVPGQSCTRAELYQGRAVPGQSCSYILFSFPLALLAGLG